MIRSMGFFGFFEWGRGREVRGKFQRRWESAIGELPPREINFSRGGRSRRDGRKFVEERERGTAGKNEA